jgi:hypothetical protein
MESTRGEVATGLVELGQRISEMLVDRMMLVARFLA